MGTPQRINTSGSFSILCLISQNQVLDQRELSRLGRNSLRKTSQKVFVGHQDSDFWVKYQGKEWPCPVTSNAFFSPAYLCPSHEILIRCLQQKRRKAPLSVVQETYYLLPLLRAHLLYSLWALSALLAFQKFNQFLYNNTWTPWVIEYARQIVDVCPLRAGLFLGLTILDEIILKSMKTILKWNSHFLAF